MDFGVPLLQVPLLQQQAQHLLRMCCLHQPQKQGGTAGCPACCPPGLQQQHRPAGPGTGGHLQNPEHHLGVIEEGVGEAEEPQSSDLGLLGLRKSLANNPEGKAVQEGWTLFKDLKDGGAGCPMCWKMSQWGRKLAWLNRELSLELREKRPLEEGAGCF